MPGASGRPFDVDKAHLLAGGLVQEADRLVAAPGREAGRPLPAPVAFAALCAAERSRLDRVRPRPVGPRPPSAWEAASERYPAAYCRWREAEARLESRAGRPQAEEALQGGVAHAPPDSAPLPLKARIEDCLARRGPRWSSTTATAPAAREHPGPGVRSRADPRARSRCSASWPPAGRDREIADTLFISKKTASVHVSNLLRKLDVANRIEAGEVGRSHGLG